MTVSELIELLQKCGPDDIVVLSKDDDGNSFSPLFKITKDRYSAYAKHCGRGDIGLRDLTEVDIQYGRTEDDVMEDGEDCVTLWPIG